MNDLHKGRDSGKGWAWVTEISAVVMSLPGFGLLFHLKQRRVTGLLASVVGTVALIGAWYFLISKPTVHDSFSWVRDCGSRLPTRDFRGGNPSRWILVLFAHFPEGSAMNERLYPQRSLRLPARPSALAKCLEALHAVPGWDAYRDSRLDAAGEVLEQELLLDPENGRAWELLGLVRRDMAKTLVAVDALEKASLLVAIKSL